MNKHERYNRSEKGRARNFRYHSKGRQNDIYLKMRKDLRDSIISKQSKIIELERILLEHAKEI